MTVVRIAHGLWRWTAPRPPWHGGDDDGDVGSVYVEGDGGVALVDPQVPPDGGDDARRFWEALDRDVARAGSAHVVLTCARHARSADRIAARYAGTTTWAPASAVGSIEATVDRRFVPGMALPAGLVAWEPRVEGVHEAVLLHPGHRALLAGDLLVGDGTGGVRLLDPSRIDAPPEARPAIHAELRERLRSLLHGHPLERIIVSHGDPVLAGGAAALAVALGAAPIS